ncbi:hypothetical protein PsYK624_128060 [Phanerochaete sordida]|uniref:Uncharacterized protein n=1 Tax=Phanerochaete sordida TaxID=48140 RepID=A0A9P3GJE2_9APHY|nr:hypothetical protein PsYK624_128060 [Phanerochaete sordida]
MHRVYEASGSRSQSPVRAQAVLVHKRVQYDNRATPGVGSVCCLCIEVYPTVPGRSSISEADTFVESPLNP